MGTLGVNLNLVSSSKLRLRLTLRLSFRIGRVGTLGEGLGTLGGGGEGGKQGGALFFYHPAHAIFLGAHLDTPQGWDFSNSSARNVPRCTPRNPSGLGQQHWWVTSPSLKPVFLSFISTCIEYSSLNCLQPVFFFSICKVPT